MVVPVVRSAQGYREFVADLESHPAGLGEAQMVGVGGASAADQARLRSNKLQMSFVPETAWLVDPKLAFLDFAGSSIGLVRRRREVLVDG
jgi:uncharacterized protein (DUF2126 family)